MPYLMEHLITILATFDNWSFIQSVLNTFLVLIALIFYTLKNHTLERVSDFLFNESWPLYSHRVNYFQSTFYVTDIVVSILSN